MNAPGRHRILYFVGLLIVNLLTCVHSEGTGDVCFSLRNKTYQNNSNMIFPGAGDVWFSLNGTTYQNNSNVTLEDIGIGDNALLCRTNLTACCQNSENWPARGNWYFPNGTRVPSAGAWWDFHRTRGQMVVPLHRRRGGVIGIYHCKIPDSINVTQNIYIGVYTAGTGAGDVWFSLNGATYQNNSLVTLEDIGEGGDALLCKTNLTDCCQPPYTGENGSTIGNWFFPNGTRVPSNSSAKQWDFHRTRGQMVVRMHRRRGGVNGIYHCEIRDSMNVNQSIYIGVYTAGSGSPNVTSLTFDNQSRTLTCTSTGGPATTVTWRRDGVVITLNATHQQTKRLVDNVTATYQTVLTIDPLVSQDVIVGTYNCTVENDKGESSETVFVTDKEPTTEEPTPSQNVKVVIPTETVLVSSIQPTKSVGTTVLVSSSSCIQPTKSDGTVTTIGTVPVSSTQPTNNPPSDGTATTSVIIVVAVVIILVVILVGVVILVVLFRAKKRKQQLVINKFQNIATENEDIEMKLKQERNTEEEASSNANELPCAEGRTEEPLNIPTKSEKLMDYLNQNSTLTGDYSEIELEPNHALPAKPPRRISLSDPMPEKKEPSPMYQDIEHCYPSNTTNVHQENDIYTEPDTTSSHSVDHDSGTYETVYSEPIQPSLFTDTAETPSDSEDFQPYAPIYAITTDLPKSEEVLLKVFGSNIREICELGMGQFGKVVLAETIGLSAKDLRLSESDDYKSKSRLVAVKKLRSDAPNATREAFEKEVNFMSRLTDGNVIHILGVCYEDTPFIMMEYMEKGDLSHYLQQFKTLSTTDSEPQGQITTSTLVHISTQIASAMKYLASHNFVHRDLATRNCLVGPNYLVKISDFGMSRSLYESHYYRIHGRFVLPVRWMAYECFYGKFSQKSDVWAFGVTMWEIFTLAKEKPYNDLSDKQVIEDALRGKNRTLLAKQNMCPLKVYKIMLACWAHNSNERATFEELFELLTSIPTDQ